MNQPTSSPGLFLVIGALAACTTWAGPRPVPPVVPPPVMHVLMTPPVTKTPMVPPSIVQPKGFFPTLPPITTPPFTQPPTTQPPTTRPPTTEPPPVLVLTDPGVVSVPEGGSTNVQVKLSAPPPADVVVTVTRSAGDADLSVSDGGSLTFSPATWDTYQAVTLSAAEDDGDNQNGSATFTCSGPGLTPASVEATEADDDHTLTITSTFGTVTRNPDLPYYDDGVAVSLTAVPGDSYQFSEWAGDLVDTNNPASLAMTGDKSVTAHYGATPPAILPPSKIGKKAFTARWTWVDGGAPEGELSVASNALFTQLAPGYESPAVVNSPEYPVTNLPANRDYWYRVRRILPDARASPWSASMKARTGTGLPVFRNLLGEAPVSAGLSQEFAISNLVDGTGRLQVKSSNTNAVKATLSPSLLTLQYLWKASNTAKVTLTLTHPATGYKASYGASLRQATGSVVKVGTSALTNAGTRVAQDVTLENRTGGTIYGVRIRALGLDNAAWLINRTGLDPATRAPILDMPCVLPAGSQTVVRLVYNKAYKTQAATRPVKYGAWAVTTPFSGPLPGNGEMAIAAQSLYDGLWLLRLPANRNRLYAVWHSDDDGATWVEEPPIRATSNYLMWLDSDTAAPAERLYRVVDAGPE